MKHYKNILLDLLNIVLVVIGSILIDLVDILNRALVISFFGLLIPCALYDLDGLRWLLFSSEPEHIKTAITTFLSISLFVVIADIALKGSVSVSEHYSRLRSIRKTIDEKKPISL